MAFFPKGSLAVTATPELCQKLFRAGKSIAAK
jgi:hypothetical protein